MSQRILVSHRILVADNQDLFRVGMTRLLGVEDDLRVLAQCADAPRLVRAAQTFPGATLLSATSLTPDWSPLKAALDQAGARSIALLGNQESPEPYRQLGFAGILFRGVAPAELVQCVRSVASGGSHIQTRPAAQSASVEPDPLGQRARQRLTRKELQIVTLLVQGYKNRDIAEELGNTEQVIKNYMRSIFDKTGVSDRLELALFTLHHKVLLEPGQALEPRPPEGTGFLRRAVLSPGLRQAPAAISQGAANHLELLQTR